MNHAEVINNVNRVNLQIKQLIERFCEDLTTTISEFNQNALCDVNIEQIRQVLNELALIDIDLLSDHRIIAEYLENLTK
jgi:hypothetical protein